MEHTFQWLSLISDQPPDLTIAHVRWATQAGLHQVPDWVASHFIIPMVNGLARCDISHLYLTGQLKLLAHCYWTGWPCIEYESPATRSPVSSFLCPGLPQSKHFFHHYSPQHSPSSHLISASSFQYLLTKWSSSLYSGSGHPDTQHWWWGELQ